MIGNKKGPGAGVILLQIQNEEVYVLGLASRDGYFDLPKGEEEESSAFFMKPYLRPAIRWAREVVEDWNLIEDLKHA